jgi:hypothetical protein
MATFHVICYMLRCGEEVPYICVLHQAVSMVNYITPKSVRIHIFRQFCKVKDTQHECLILHTEVRWQSRRKICLSLKKKCEFFFKEKEIIFSANILHMTCGVIS